MASQTARRPADGQFQFPLPTVIPPNSDHNITIIFLHGRGHTPEYLHESIISMRIDGSDTFRDALPCAKIVLPSAPLMRATKYRRSLIRQWYDGTGDWEPEALGNMRQSIEHIHQLLREEIGLLGGDNSKIVLAGFSQGCAMALLSFLLWEGNALGAVVGLSGFIPLNSHMMEILKDDESNEDSDDGVVFGSDSSHEETIHGEAGHGSDPLQWAIAALRCEAELPPKPSACTSFQKTPIFLAHGTEDPEVELHHGRLTAHLLEMMGIHVDFHAYPGVAHEVSPDVLEAVISFVTKSTTNS